MQWNATLPGLQKGVSYNCSFKAPQRIICHGAVALNSIRPYMCSVHTNIHLEKINTSASFFFFSLSTQRWKRHIQSQGHLPGMCYLIFLHISLKLVDYASKVQVRWMADNLGGRYSLNSTHYWQVKGTKHRSLLLIKFAVGCGYLSFERKPKSPEEE